jgi:hypothetical protein
MDVNKRQCAWTRQTELKWDGAQMRIGGESIKIHGDPIAQCVEKLSQAARRRLGIGTQVGPDVGWGNRRRLDRNVE